MIELLVDTNAFSAWQGGREPAVSVLKATRTLGISAIVLGELLQGFSEGNREAVNRRELAAFLSISSVRIIPVTDTTADVYANLLTALRRAGTPIPTNDVWIAASAIEHGMALWTYDKHFSRISGLKVVREVIDLA